MSLKNDGITLARAQSDFYHWRRVVAGLEKKATRVNNRVAAQREVRNLTSSLHTNVILTWTQLDWDEVAKKARRLAYLAQGFKAEEDLPTARAQFAAKSRALNAARKAMR